MRDGTKTWDWRHGPIHVGSMAIGDDRGVWLVERHIRLGPLWCHVERNRGHLTLYASIGRRSVKFRL